jgi:GT2 family glycosyltransferase
MESPRVAIIVLNWNGVRDTLKCLDSLKQITYPNYEVLVIDNASQEQEAAILEEKYKGFIKIIRNSTNRGFAGGNNQGIQWLKQNSKPAYFLLLNNDTLVHPDFLTELVRLAESDSSIGIVGPKTYVTGLSQVIQTVYFKVDMQKGRVFHAGYLEKDTGQYEQNMVVDFVQGSCFLIKHQVIDKIGLLDEAFFSYWEDTDYCFRARENGFKVYYAAKAVIWHKNKNTLLEPWYKTLFSNRKAISATDARLIARNKFRFMQKHATRSQYCTFICYYFGYWFWYKSGTYLFFFRQPGVFLAYLKAVWQGLSKPNQKIS